MSSLACSFSRLSCWSRLSRRAKGNVFLLLIPALQHGRLSYTNGVVGDDHDLRRGVSPLAPKLLFHLQPLDRANTQCSRVCLNLPIPSSHVVLVPRCFGWRCQISLCLSYSALSFSIASMSTTLSKSLCVYLDIFLFLYCLSPCVCSSLCASVRDSCIRLSPCVPLLCVRLLGMRIRSAGFHLS